MVLQQPDSLAAAKNFAKLKKSVLVSSDKKPTFDVKQGDRLFTELGVELNLS